MCALSVSESYNEKVLGLNDSQMEPFDEREIKENIDTSMASSATSAATPVPQNTPANNAESNTNTKNDQIETDDVASASQESSTKTTQATPNAGNFSFSSTNSSTDSSVSYYETALCSNNNEMSNNCFKKNSSFYDIRNG